MKFQYFFSPFPLWLFLFREIFSLLSAKGVPSGIPRVNNGNFPFEWGRWLEKSNMIRNKEPWKVD